MVHPRNSSPALRCDCLGVHQHVCLRLCVVLFVSVYHVYASWRLYLAHVSAQLEHQTEWVLVSLCRRERTLQCLE